MRRGPRALLFVALTGITVEAAGTLEGRELRPLMRGWEQLFALEYGLGQYRGQPAVEGYVINISPYGFTRIRILIDALDADDQVVAQRVAYVPGALGGRGRTIASNLSATRFVEGPAGIHAPRRQRHCASPFCAAPDASARRKPGHSQDNEAPRCRPPYLLAVATRAASPKYSASAGSRLLDHLKHVFA